jgi:hypothetical protein
MTRIEREVENHSQCDRKQRGAASADEGERERSHGVVQRSDGRVLGRGCFVEEPHCRQRVPTVLAEAEPEVVVHVHDDAPRPEAERAAIEAPVEQRRARR